MKTNYINYIQLKRELAHEARLIYAPAAYWCSNYKLNIDMQLD